MAHFVSLCSAFCIFNCCPGRKQWKLLEEFILRGLRLRLAKVTENDSALLCLKTQGSSVSSFLSLTMCQIRHRSVFITIIIHILLALKSTTQVQCLGLGSLGIPGIPTQVTTPSSAPVPLYPRPLPVLSGSIQGTWGWWWGCWCSQAWPGMKVPRPTPAR